jgi:Amiloride-sensitive sodium channel
MTAERREQYSRTDFLANCGGLLGLLMGISVISFVEIVYFCTIRLWCNLKLPNVTISDQTEVVRIERTNRYVKILKELIADYSSKTTIQGVNYVADTNLSLAERIWWTIVVVISMFCCGSLIMDVIRQHDESPFIVSFANEPTSIAQVYLNEFSLAMKTRYD